MPSETKIDVAKVIVGLSTTRQRIAKMYSHFKITGLEVLEERETPATQTAITISEETKQQGLEACQNVISRINFSSELDDNPNLKKAEKILEIIKQQINDGNLAYSKVKDMDLLATLMVNENLNTESPETKNEIIEFITSAIDETDGALEAIDNNNTYNFSRIPEEKRGLNEKINDSKTALENINKLMSVTNVKEYNKTDSPYQPIALAFFIADTTIDAENSATDLQKFLSDIYPDDINKQKEWVDKLAKEAKASGVPEDKADQVSKFAKAKIDNPKLDFKKKASIFSRVAQAVARAPGAVVNFIGSGISMAGNVIKNTIMMPVKLISSLLPNTKTPEIENPQNDAANVTSVDDVTSERFHSARSSRNPTPEPENDALKQQSKEAAQDMPASEKVSRNNQPERTAANKQPTQIGR